MRPQDSLKSEHATNAGRRAGFLILKSLDMPEDFCASSLMEARSPGTRRVTPDTRRVLYHGSMLRLSRLLNHQPVAPVAPVAPCQNAPGCRWRKLGQAPVLGVCLLQGRRVLAPR